MPSPNFLQLFDSIYQKWKSLNFTAIYKEQLGTASFKYFEPEIEKLTSKIEQINQVKNELSDSLLDKLSKHFTGIFNQLNALANYNDAQFVTEKGTNENQIRREIEWITEAWPNVLAVIHSKTQNSEQIKELVNQIKELSEKSIKDATQIEELKTRLSEELNSFETRYKDSITKRELVKQQDIFSTHAAEYRKSSSKWLIAIIISSGLFLFILWLILKDFCFDLSCYQKVGDINYERICVGCNKTILYLEIFKSIAYRLLLISFFIYIISFCVRNYNSIMHNYTVNSHKANSLDAALVLLERAKTEEGNDSIMSQAANAIFSHQPTGYNSKDPENMNQTITEKIIEKINPISK